MTIPAQDIVERLRERAAAREFGAEPFFKEIFVEWQAADTISRLTADNEALRKENAHLEIMAQFAGEADARADSLAQEVERLKAEKENLQGVLQAAHDALKRDIPAKAFHAVRAAIRALANEEAGR